jgi:DNA-binding transcriptional MocR family regulator
MDEDSGSGAPTASRAVRSEDRVAEVLRRRVAKLAPGALVPSVREWTHELGVSPVTVQRALSQLAREGILDPRPGVGTFVAEPAVAAAPRDDAWQLAVLGAWTDSPEGRAFELAPPNHIDFGTGYLDASAQPTELVARALRRVSSQRSLLRRLPVEGLDELRAWFAREMGGGARASDVLVVPGGQAAIATTLRALCPYGGTVIAESPTYFGALALMRTLGLRVWPVPIDSEGVRVDALESALQASGARAVYLQPQWSNPSGVSLSSSRRAAVLDLCARAGAFVIEDDYARDLGHSSSFVAPMAHRSDGRVVYLRTLTKLTVPALRVAAIVARGPVFERLRALRAAEDMFLSGLLQGLALEVVTAHGWEAHKRSVRAALRARCELAVECIASRFEGARVCYAPDGGFSLWVELPEGVEDAAFARAAYERGVRVHEGRAWFPAAKTGEFIRVSVAGTPLDDVRRGVALLGQISARARRPRARATRRGAS